MRVCRKCFIPKDSSEFGVNRIYEDNKSKTCKQCNREHTRKLRARSFDLLRNTKVKVSYSLLGFR